MEKDFSNIKTGYSTSIKISTMKNIEDGAKQLGTGKSDIGRRIFEYFFEHNDIEDLKEWNNTTSL